MSHVVREKYAVWYAPRLRFTTVGLTYTLMPLNYHAAEPGRATHIRIPDSKMLPLLAQYLGEQAQRAVDVSVGLQGRFEMVAVFCRKGVMVRFSLSRALLPLSWRL